MCHLISDFKDQLQMYATINRKMDGLDGDVDRCFKNRKKSRKINIKP